MRDSRVMMAQQPQLKRHTKDNNEDDLRGEMELQSKEKKKKTRAEIPLQRKKIVFVLFGCHCLSTCSLIHLLLICAYKVDYCVISCWLLDIKLVFGSGSQFYAFIYCNNNCCVHTRCRAFDPKIKKYVACVKDRDRDIN